MAYSKNAMYGRPQQLQTSTCGRNVERKGSSLDWRRSETSLAHAQKTAVGLGTWADLKLPANLKTILEKAEGLARQATPIEVAVEIVVTDPHERETWSPDSDPTNDIALTHSPLIVHHHGATA